MQHQQQGPDLPRRMKPLHATFHLRRVQLLGYQNGGRHGGLSTVAVASVSEERNWVTEKQAQQQFQVDSVSYRHRLFQCRKLSEGKQIHADVARDGLEDDEHLASYLVHMYLKFASLKDAREAFRRMHCEDVGLWTSIITAYARFGQYKEALELYHLMQLEGVVPNRVTLVVVVNLCIMLEDIAEGRKVRDCALSCGYESDVTMGNSLLNLYRKCGSLEETTEMFDQVHQRDVVSWTTMIKAYAEQGQCKDALLLFQQMQLEGTRPNRTTILTILTACTSYLASGEGQMVHACIRGSDLELDVMVSATLVNMYSKFGNLEEACGIFAKMPERNLVAWNIMIAAYAQHGYGTEALQLLKSMQLEGIQPDKVTFVNSLNACSSPAALKAGECIHACCFEFGVEGDIVLGTALVNMYSKCGSLEDAFRMFNKMQQRNLVSWNAMMAAYTQHSHFREALNLFRVMELEGYMANNVTFATVLNACGGMEALEEGERINARIVGTGSKLGLVLGTALIDMYSKCGSLEHARKIFDGMREQDVVLWTTMIGAYTQYGYHEEALKLFQQMRLKPDNITFVSAVDACANVGSLREGELLHDRIKKCGLESDVLVGTVLVYMYAKFGCLEKASSIFKNLDQWSVVSWNAVIGAYAQQGYVREALEHLRKMLAEGMRPDDITFATVLDTFVSQSYLGEGRLMHAHIVESGYESSVFLGTALVNMYGKCGSLEEAWKMFSKLSQRNVVSWNALIAACAQHGHLNESLQLFQQMQHEGVFADNITFVSIISACSHAGLLDKGCEYMVLMIEDHGIVPFPEHYGCMIDLLGRAGWLREAEYLVTRLPQESQSLNWMALLNACRMHGDVQRGKRAAERALQLQPGNTGAYIMLSNIYAGAGRWDDVSKLKREMMAERLCGQSELTNYLEDIPNGAADGSNPERRRWSSDLF